MNLFESRDDNKKYLSTLGYSDAQLDKLFKSHRPLGACTYFVYNQMKEHFGGDLGEILKHIEIVPVPVSESRGTLTGKYAAKDKITSSSVDLLGDESISRLLHLADADMGLVSSILILVYGILVPVAGFVDFHVVVSVPSARGTIS